MPGEAAREMISGCPCYSGCIDCGPAARRSNPSLIKETSTPLPSSAATDCHDRAYRTTHWDAPLMGERPSCFGVGMASQVRAPVGRFPRTSLRELNQISYAVTSCAVLVFQHLRNDVLRPRSSLDERSGVSGSRDMRARSGGTGALRDSPSPRLRLGSSLKRRKAMWARAICELVRALPKALIESETNVQGRAG